MYGKLKYIYLFVALQVFVFSISTGCRKKKSPPKIIFDSPYFAQKFNIGSTVGVSARITDNRSVDSVFVFSIEDTAHYIYTPSSKSFTATGDFIMPQRNSMTLIIRAVDSDGNESRENCVVYSY